MINFVQELSGVPQVRDKDQRHWVGAGHVQQRLLQQPAGRPPPHQMDVLGVSTIGKTHRM